MLDTLRRPLPTTVTNIFIDIPTEPNTWERFRGRTDVQLTLADPIASDFPVTRPANQISGAQCVLCTHLPVNLDDMSSLSFVQIASSGYTQLVGLDLPAKKIRACNARGVSDTAIAEWNMTMLVCLARNMKQMIRNQDLHIWDRAANFQREIRGATVGLWGYGGIARQTARLSKALGLRVHVLSRSAINSRGHIYHVPDSGDIDGSLPDQVYSLEHRHDFLRELDFLVLCTPLTPATEGMIGIDEFQALPRGAFLLNPARGPLVKEAALLQALREGWLGGAALDTHYEYPLPPEHPLWAFDNVIITPHISGSGESPFFLQRIWTLFEENVRRFQSGHELLNELTPAQLAGC